MRDAQGYPVPLITLRERYAAVESAPSRFANEGQDYAEWAIRAHAYGLGAGWIMPKGYRTAQEQGAALGSNLAHAAIGSAQIVPLSVSGRRYGDPLELMIPGDGHTSPEILRTVESIVGHPVTGVNTAPACRAALRRWAVAQ